METTIMPNKNIFSFPSLLFCPGDRPDRFEKALQRADSVILDLEDAVLPDAKEAARLAIIASNLPPERVIVRVNAADSSEFNADLAAVLQTKYRTIMVAKAESCDELANIPRTIQVIALCETALGVREAAQIAQLENVVALMWGAEDLIASMGGTSSRDEQGEYRDVAKFARSQVLIAARAAGKIAIDSVFTNIPDLEGLKKESQDAAASGFQAKACIHPDQVHEVRVAYLPSEKEVDDARALLEIAESERGVFQYQGQMIDEPILRHARSVLDRAMVGAR